MVIFEIAERLFCSLPLISIILFYRWKKKNLWFEIRNLPKFTARETYIHDLNLAGRLQPLHCELVRNTHTAELIIKVTDNMIKLLNNNG